MAFTETDISVVFSDFIQPDVSSNEPPWIYFGTLGNGTPYTLAFKGTYYDDLGSLSGAYKLWANEDVDSFGSGVWSGPLFIQYREYVAPSINFDPTFLSVLIVNTGTDAQSYDAGLFVAGSTNAYELNFSQDVIFGAYGGSAVVSQVPAPGSVPFVPVPVVPDRPVDYDPDAKWDEETGTWLDIPAAGGGAYENIVVMVGDGGEVFTDIINMILPDYSASVDTSFDHGAGGIAIVSGAFLLSPIASGTWKYDAADATITYVFTGSVSVMTVVSKDTPGGTTFFQLISDPTQQLVFDSPSVGSGTVTVSKV